MIEILQTSLIIALFCVSWDILLTYEPNEPKRNQMLLYFFRKMVYEYEEAIKETTQFYKREITAIWESKIKALDLQNNSDSNKLLCRREIDYDRDNKYKDINIREDKKTNWLFYLKPIITCKYCFPSFYGTIIFIMLHGFHVEQWATWFLSIVCSVILVGIISGIHEKLIK